MKEEPIIAQDTRENNGSSGYLGTCQSVSGVYSLQEARMPQGERKPMSERFVYSKTKGKWLGIWRPLRALFCRGKGTVPGVRGHHRHSVVC